VYFGREAEKAGVPRGTDYQALVRVCNHFYPGYLSVFSKKLTSCQVVVPQKIEQNYCKQQEINVGDGPRKTGYQTNEDCLVSQQKRGQL